MDQVQRIILENLNNRQTRFVFPSEIAAHFWQREVLRLSQKKAVRKQRFISWDRFKEDRFFLNRDERPVNSLIRSVFADHLLDENRKQPFLKAFVFPGYAEHSRSFRKSLESVLPRLQALLKNDLSVLGDDLHQDFVLLNQRYDLFLNENNLFEPSTASPDLSSLEGDWIIFFPELIEDYAEFAHHLVTHSRVQIVSLPKAPPTRMKQFGNMLTEIRWLFGELTRVLNQGTNFNNIFLTLPDRKFWAPLLHQEGLKYGIPFDLRSGATLSETPEGALWGKLQELHSSRMNLDLMQSLLLSAVWPWKEPEINRRLIRFGYENGCFRNYPEDGAEVDLWARRLRRSKKDEDLYGYYTRFKNALRKLVSAGSVPVLKREALQFSTTFFDTEHWDAAGRLTWQASLDQLNRLQEIADQLDGIKVDRPFSFWLESLADRIYVSKESAPGIPVYSYRVSAGCNPEYHYLPGFTQSGTEIAVTPFPFLREDQALALGCVDEVLTTPFLQAYQMSGKSVALSCSREYSSGPALAPSKFVMEGLIDSLGPDDVPFDSYDQELQYWAVNGRCPGLTTPVQHMGLERAKATVFASEGKSLAHEVHSGFTASRSGNILATDQSMKISPTRMERFYACPYQYLWDVYGQVEDPEFQINIEDPRLIGVLYHKSLQLFFEKIKDRYTVFRIDQMEEYVPLLIASFEEAASGVEKAERAPLPPVWSRLKTLMEKDLLLFLEQEGRHFHNARIVGLEAKYSIEIAGENLELEGIIDRVASTNDGLFVIDYKKTLRIKKDFLVPGEGGEAPVSFQIPFYLYLLKKTGHTVAGGSYYNFNGKKYVHVAGDNMEKPWLSLAEMENLADNIGDYAIKMKRRLYSGDFRINADECDSCSFKRICRKDFFIR